jgi:hypothetical protein
MGEEKELICIAVDGNVVYSISYPESKMYSCYSPGIGYGKMYIPGYKTSLISSIY